MENLISEINENEIANIIFSLNKKAKNIREEQRNIVYKKKQKITKSNKGEIALILNNLKEQKFLYYEEKDRLLSTYFEPTCIHKAQHTTKEFEYEHNMKDCIDVDSLLKINFKGHFAFNFLEEKYQKKMKCIQIGNQELKTNLYVFNDFIQDKILIDTICEELNRKLSDIVVKGNKIYIPYFRKEAFYNQIDFIFVKHLWNGKRIVKPQGFKTVLEFGNIKIAQKTNIISTENKYYLFYKMNEHSFHKPINESELEKYSNLEIIDVVINTRGEDEDNLLDDFEIKEKLEKIQN